MSILERLKYNNCSYCLDQGIKNASYIDIEWRNNINGGYWPAPFQESGFCLERVKAIVIGQDPTIHSPRSIKYVLDADMVTSKLGEFLRQVFGNLRNVGFDEIYITNLVKCRFKEKPGKDNRSIYTFTDCMASECYSRFLIHEIVECRNARYLFTLGRDTFEIMSNLLNVDHPPLTLFKEFYGTKFGIQSKETWGTLYLVPLPHQPTYDIANRFSPYSEIEVRKRLSDL
jgi:uracil-DNA glycosylase